MSIVDLNTRGLVHFSTREAAFRFERSAAQGVAKEAQDRKLRVECEMRMIADSFGDMRDCGVDRIALSESLAGLLDAASDAVHKCHREMDAAGWYFDPEDFSEARALLDALRGRP